MEEQIKTIIDSYLQEWVDSKLNKLPIQIDAEMADPNQNEKEEWRFWFPIKSKITDNEIEEFEIQLGYKLPQEYKVFLKFKHFYELNIAGVSFCRHSVHSWRKDQVEMIFDGYPTEFLIEKGYIPFADYSDWGLLCFDANRNKEDHNYPVVLWDHEIPDEVKEVYNDFYDLIIKIDQEDKENRD